MLSQYPPSAAITYLKEMCIRDSISVIEYGDRSASLVEVISHMSNQAVVNWGEFVRILENCRYQVAEREVTAFWEKYDEQTENSQKQIEFCNEAIRKMCIRDSFQTI